MRHNNNALSLRTIDKARLSRRINLSSVGAALALTALLAGCSSNTTPNRPKTPSTTIAEDSSNLPSVLGMAGGCKPFTVYAQNRWDPLGAVLRSAPDATSVRIGGFAGNTPVQVDGYVEVAEPAYPNNQDPYKGREWFHDVAGGWITSAALRATPTEPDPTGLAFGGPTVPLRPECLSRPVS